MRKKKQSELLKQEHYQLLPAYTGVMRWIFRVTKKCEEDLKSQDHTAEW